MNVDLILGHIEKRMAELEAQMKEWEEDDQMSVILGRMHYELHELKMWITEKMERQL